MIDKHFIVYTLFPRMILATALFPTSIPGWEGTLVKERGSIGLGQTVSSPGFVKFLLEQMDELMKPVSPIQMKRIEMDMKKDIRRLASSGTYKSAMNNLRGKTGEDI